MRSILFTLCLLCAAALSAKPLVIVSVAPEKVLVESVADGSVDVEVLVPAGFSPHTYEPTPRQIIRASKAALWFRIGESFERNLLAPFKGMEIVDLRDGLDLLGGCCSHCKDGCDTHIWMSARLVKQQVDSITKALTKLLPESQALFEANAQAVKERLDSLDAAIEERLAAYDKRVVLVSHPAFAYFCRDYNLEQWSLECEGKELSPKQLAEKLQAAKGQELTHLFIQQQYNPKGARLFAKLLGAEVVTLDPYGEDLFETLNQVTDAFSSSLPIR